MSMLNIWPFVRKARPTNALEFNLIASYADFLSFQSQHSEVLASHRAFELDLIAGPQRAFSLKGYCHVCDRGANFKVDYQYSYEQKADGGRIPNWRESITCPKCGLNNRMRAAVHLFEHLLKPGKKSDVYVTEMVTPLYAQISRRYPNAIGSEYLGPQGPRFKDGIRNEDITHLSFGDGQFDFILSFDVFEHVPDLGRAFAECLRVLKPGGSLFFSVPAGWDQEKTLVRATIDSNGEIQHHVPPEYHCDPVGKQGILSIYTFGWQLLDDLRGYGFVEPQACHYWSSDYGYLGAGQRFYVARKESRAS